jgi:hypothetical protein
MIDTIVSIYKTFPTVNGRNGSFVQRRVRCGVIQHLDRKEAKALVAALMTEQDELPKIGTIEAEVGVKVYLPKGSVILSERELSQLEDDIDQYNGLC